MKVREVVCTIEKPPIKIGIERDKKERASISGGSGGRGGGGSCNCGTWGDLRDIAQNNPSKTAGDIIREWRKSH